MKPTFIAMASVCLFAVAGCATSDAPRSELAKDESCRVTGSNLPKRECRGDVSNLPPSAVERVGTITPAPIGKGN